MYEIADKYDVDVLKILARDKFNRSYIKYWDHELFLPAFEYVLTSTPDEDQGLREILCKTVVSHAMLLEQRSVQELLGNHPGFAFSVIKRQAAELGRLKKSS
jgi:hypothetical protein